jgi:hypothetical protein
MFTWARQPAKSAIRFFQASRDLLVTCQSTEAVFSVKSAVSSILGLNNHKHNAKCGKGVKIKCSLTTQLQSSAYKEVLLNMFFVNEIAFYFLTPNIVKKLQ